MTQEQRENVEEWAVAMESGKYPQTIGCLRDTTGYCCIAVACVIKGVQSRKEGDEYRFFFGETEDGEEISETGDANDCWFYRTYGIESRTELINMNDSGGYDFPEIAAYIRKTYLSTP